MTDEFFMNEALKEAKMAFDNGEIPVGAVVVKNGEIIGRGHNLREIDHDISGHAEIVAMRDAATHNGDWRLTGCTLYVTLEPCLMCSGAILQSRVSRLVFGATDSRDGAIVSNYFSFDSPCVHERPLINFGVLSNESQQLLKMFFEAKRV